MKIGAIVTCLAVLNFSPWWLDTAISHVMDTARLSGLHGLGARLPLSMLNLWWLGALAINVVVLRDRRWAPATRWTQLGLGLFGTWILWWMLANNAGLFRHVLEVPTVPGRHIRAPVGRLIQLGLASALVASLVASFRRLRRLIKADGPLLVDRLRTAARRERRWSVFERTLRRDLKGIYEFYLDEDTRSRLRRMGPLSKTLHMAAWLMKSLYYKLTPARRVLLVIALALSVLSLRIDEETVRHRGVGFLVLLLILFLELKDKLLALDELAVGRAVQKALLPTRNPRISGWDLWLHTQPANEVGGDLVDYIEMSEGRWGIALGDVAGKGLGAALLMAKLQATLRALAPSHDSLSALGHEINGIIYRDGLRDRFASMVYIELQPDSGSLRILNAGHMPPMILTPEGIEEMPRGGPAFAILPKTDYEEQRLELQIGELLVVYSDGLSEAMSAEGDFFGEHRLRQILQPLRALSTEAIGARTLSEVEKFIGEAPPFDDLSLVLLKRVG